MTDIITEEEAITNWFARRHKLIGFFTVVFYLVIMASLVYLRFHLIEIKNEARPRLGSTQAEPYPDNVKGDIDLLPVGSWIIESDGRVWRKL